MVQLLGKGGTGLLGVLHKGFCKLFGEDVAVDVVLEHAAVYVFPLFAVRGDVVAVLQTVFEVRHFVNKHYEHDVWRQIVVKRYQVSALRRGAIGAELSAARRYQSDFRISISGELPCHFVKRLCRKMCG